MGDGLNRARAAARATRKPKAKPERFGTHYDTIPHGNCQDPARCDCSCDGCLTDFRSYLARGGKETHQPKPRTT